MKITTLAGGIGGSKFLLGLAGYVEPEEITIIANTGDDIEMFGLRISGFVAWLLWRGVYLLKIPTLARKTRLFLEWNWAMFFPPDISHLGYRRTKRTSSVQPVGKIANG